MTNFIKAIAVCICLLITSTIYCQAKKPGVMFGVNISYSEPKGDFAANYKGGIGAEGLAGVGWGKTFLTGSVGATAFMAQAKSTGGTLTSIPIKLGVRHYLLAKRLFINGDVGITSVKDKSTQISQSRFTRGIGAGVRLFGLEAGLYYDGFKNIAAPGFSNFIQYKLGFNFSL